MSGYTRPKKEMADGISRAASSKCWVPTEYNQHRTKENTLKCSRNENNAVTDDWTPITQATESQLSFQKEQQPYDGVSLSILNNPKIQYLRDLSLLIMRTHTRARNFLPIAIGHKKRSQYNH